MIYNKLVRDRIPEIILSKGGKPKTHIATTKEFSEALRAKLTEEVNEFLQSLDPEELADILEVIYALAQDCNVSISDLEKMRAKKAAERGAFDKRIILEES